MHFEGANIYGIHVTSKNNIKCPLYNLYLNSISLIIFIKVYSFFYYPCFMRYRCLPVKYTLFS